MHLDDLESYLACPLAYYWRASEKAEDKPRARSTRLLPRRLLLNALRVYHKTQGNYALTDLLPQVVNAWLQKEGRSAEEVQAVLQYAEIRRRVMAVFRSGRVRKADGSLYKQPQWSNRYREMMRSAGAGELEQGLVVTSQNLGWTVAQHGEYKYHVGEAVADAWDAAGNIKMPPAERIMGVMATAQVGTDWGEIIFEMDMLTKNSKGDVVGWVIYADPWREITKPWVGRQPRVLATALGTCLVDGETVQPSLVWYVDALRGWAHRRQRLSLYRLGWLLGIAQRGIRHGVYTPRFFAEPPFVCQTCAYYKRCFVDATESDPLEHILPGGSQWIDAR